MTTIYFILLTLFIVLSLFMILLVLIQKGRGGGLSAAFGGVGGNTAFGAKTGDVLTWATSIVFGVFILLAIIMNLIANRIHTDATDINAGTTPLVQPTGGTPLLPTDLEKALTPTTMPTTTPSISPTNSSTNTTLNTPVITTQTTVVPATQP